MKKFYFFTVLFIVLSISVISNNAVLQWIQTTGPGGGNVMCLSIVNNDVFTGLAPSSNSAGVYYSYNDGNTWKACGYLGYADVRAIVYNGTYLFCGTTSGVNLSTNYGVNWFSANNGLSGNGAYKLVASGSNLFAGTGNGIYISTNNGASWALSGISGTQITALAVVGSNIFAGTSFNGVYRTTNNGGTWNTVNSGLGSNLFVTDIVSNGNTVYVANGNRVYLSTNNGNNWTQTSLNASGTIYAIAVNGSYLIAGSEEQGTYRSTNNGSSWSQISMNKWVEDIMFKGNVAYLAAYIGYNTSNGIYKSTDYGLTWVESGVTNQTINAFAVIGTNIYAGKMDGAYLTSNNGNVWTNITNGLSNNDFQTMASGGGYLFGGTESGGVYRTSNNGTNWLAVNNGLISQQVRALLHNGSYLFAATTAGVFRSTNNGDLWSSINSGITNLNMWCLGGGSNAILAGGQGGIYSSTNNGVNWVYLGLSITGVNKLTMNGNVILASSYGAFSRSPDNGQNWYPCGTSEMLPVGSLISSGNLFFAGCGSNGAGKGIFMSTDYGLSWINRNQGFEYLPSVRCLIIANNYIFAGTDTQSVWRRAMSDIIGIKQISEEIPASYTLSQNYPNPFNPSTTINFEVPEPSFVKISLFDITGKEIGVLVNEHLKPGTYETQWEASKYSSGVYFYTLMAGDFKETKRMLLIK